MARHDFTSNVDVKVNDALNDCNNNAVDILHEFLPKLTSDIDDATEIAIIKTMAIIATDEIGTLLPNYMSVANNIRLLDDNYSSKVTRSCSDINNIAKIVKAMTEVMTSHNYKGNTIPQFVLPPEYTLPILSSNYIIKLIKNFLLNVMAIDDSNLETQSTHNLPAFYTSSFVEDKLRDYIQIIDSDDDSWTKTMKSVKWLSGIRGMKSNIEKVFDTKFDLPDGSPIKEGFDFIKALDMYTKFTDGTYKYFTGQYDGDIETMMQGGTELKKAFKSMMGIKTKGIFDEHGEELYGILIDYAINLSDNMEEAFYQYSLGNYSRTQVYEQVFGETFIESTMDTLKPFTTIAADVVYKPISGISRFIGIDLDAEYAKFSDANSGSGRLSDGFDEIDKIVKESGGYFENWKSGMKLIIDKITN